MGAHDENEKDDLHTANYFTAPGSEKDGSCIGHTMDARMSELELAEQPSSIGRQSSHSEDQNNGTGDVSKLVYGTIRRDLRGYANSCHGGRQR